eukprot:4252706-Pleurochrysis_carterae.AAC.1
MTLGGGRLQQSVNRKQRVTEARHTSRISESDGHITSSIVFGRQRYVTDGDASLRASVNARDTVDTCTYVHKVRNVREYVPCAPTIHHEDYTALSVAKVPAATRSVAARARGQHDARRGCHGCRVHAKRLRKRRQPLFVQQGWRRCKCAVALAENACSERDAS